MSTLNQTERAQNLAKTGYETKSESKLSEMQILDNTQSKQYSNTTGYVSKNKTDDIISSSASLSSPAPTYSETLKRDVSAQITTATPGSDLGVIRENQSSDFQEVDNRSLKEKGMDKFAELKEGAKLKMDEAKEKLQPKLDQAKLKMDEAKEKLQPKLDQAKSFASEKLASGKQMASDLKNQVQDKMSTDKSASLSSSSSEFVSQDRLPLDSESRVELLHDNFGKSPLMTDSDLSRDRSAGDIKTEANQIFTEMKSGTYSSDLPMSATSSQTEVLAIKDEPAFVSNDSKMQDLKLQGQAKLENAKSFASDKLEQGKQMASDKLEQGKQMASDLKANAGVKLEAAKEQLKPTLEQAKEKAVELGNFAQQKAVDAKNFVAATIESGKEKVQDYLASKKTDQQGEILASDNLLVKEQPQVCATRATTFVEGVGKQDEVRREIQNQAFVEGKRDTAEAETGGRVVVDEKVDVLVSGQSKLDAAKNQAKFQLDSAKEAVKDKAWDLKEKAKSAAVNATYKIDELVDKVPSSKVETDTEVKTVEKTREVYTEKDKIIS